MLDDTVVALRQAGNVEDPLTDLLRAGARQLLAQAVYRRWTAAPGAAWSRSGARDPDRDRSGPGAPGQASRSRRGRPERTHPLHVGHPAAVRTAAGAMILDERVVGVALSR